MSVVLFVALFACLLGQVIDLTGVANSAPVRFDDVFASGVGSGLDRAALSSHHDLLHLLVESNGTLN